MSACVNVAAKVCGTFGHFFEAAGKCDKFLHSCSVDVYIVHMCCCIKTVAFIRSGEIVTRLKKICSFFSFACVISNAGNCCRVMPNTHCQRRCVKNPFRAQKLMSWRFWLSHKTVRKLAELPIYCQRQKCSPGILVPSKVSFMGILAGVRWRGGVK